ncbi:hypothetical protein LYSHEL_24330 [Lysobacter helvus]|uniref:Uncharacterized protein n=2 Tax=Lysobacteraceae TaxID=32033 RepID=A0ABN6FUP7_9GAMM|nr:MULTISPECIES: hypothetical protein [Lysobacter]BCT93409.1 hypothetical protein LYSCAS_24330 [Lysobacter caseinilyticus]BCT96562.1 hypothetical protein LYSHEL_24330 [Lysobacter helvus]
MREDKSGDRFDNGVIAVGCAIILVLALRDHGLAAMGRYAVYLACIVGDGLFLSAVLTKPRRPKRIVACSLLMIAANVAAAFMTYPHLAFVVGFWIPALAGYLSLLLIRARD